MHNVAKLGASLDLRFPDKESEAAFAKSLEQNVAWAAVLAAALWAAAGTLRIAEAGVRGRVGDAQLWSHLACCLLGAAFAGLAVLRPRCALLARWNWEFLAVAMLSCLAWQVAALVVSGGGEARYTLAQSNLVIAAGACVPLRSVVSWIIPTSALLASVVRHAALAHGSDDEYLVDVFAALCVGVLAHSGARRQERLLRDAWKSRPCDVERTGADLPSKSEASGPSDFDSEDVERSTGVHSIVPALPGAVPTGSSAWPNPAKPSAAARRAADGTPVQGGQARPEPHQTRISPPHSVSTSMGSADMMLSDLESQASGAAGLGLLREGALLPLPSAGKREQAMAVQAEELRAAQAALEATRGELGEAHAALEASRGELGATQAALEASRAELGAAQQALEASRAELGEAQAALEAARTDVPRLDACRALATAFGAAALAAQERAAVRERACTAADSMKRAECGRRQRVEERLRKPHEGGAGLRPPSARPAAPRVQRAQTGGSQKPPFMPKRAERMEFSALDSSPASAFSSEGECSEGRTTLPEELDLVAPGRSTSLRSFGELGPAEGSAEAAVFLSSPSARRGARASMSSSSAGSSHDLAGMFQFDGTWFLISITDQPGDREVDTWLVTLQITGDEVIDGTGTVNKLVLSDGDILFAGGRLSMRGDRLYRYGRTGACYEYERQEAAQGGGEADCGNVEKTDSLSSNWQSEHSTHD